MRKSIFFCMAQVVRLFEKRAELSFPKHTGAKLMEIKINKSNKNCFDLNAKQFFPQDSRGIDFLLRIPNGRCFLQTICRQRTEFPSTFHTCCRQLQIFMSTNHTVPHLCPKYPCHWAASGTIKSSFCSWEAFEKAILNATRDMNCILARTLKTSQCKVINWGQRLNPVRSCTAGRQIKETSNVAGSQVFPSLFSTQKQARSGVFSLPHFFQPDEERFVICCCVARFYTPKTDCWKQVVVSALQN